MAPRIGRHISKPVLCFVKPLNVARSGGKGREGEEAEGVDDQIDGCIGHGLGACCGGVAVDDASLGQIFDIDPVIASCARRVDLAGRREKVSMPIINLLSASSSSSQDSDLHQLLVPTSHLAACRVERSKNCIEVAKLLRFKRRLELLSSHAVTSLDVELVLQLRVKFMIPANIISAMQKTWLVRRRRRHGGQLVHRYCELASCLG